MPSKAATPGEGVIKITLQEEIFELKPSLYACMQVCNSGGFESTNPADSTVTKRLLALDLPTMVWLIKLGLGQQFGPSALPDLPERVFAEGLNKVRGDLAPFLGSLRDGGRIARAPGEGEDENPPLGGA